MSEVLQAVGFGMVASSIIAIGATGFTLQFAVSKFFNLGYGSIITIAAFATYLLNVTLGIDLVLASVGGAVAGALGSWLLYKGIFGPFLGRGAGPFAMAMVSLAVAFVLENGTLAVAGANFFSYEVPREQALSIGPISWTPRQIMIMGVALSFMVAVHAVLRFTRLGKAMRATAEDAKLAAGCGIDTSKIISVVWLMSGFLCGATGVVLALNLNSFDTTIGATFLLMVIPAALVGGVGQPYGAMAGALIIGTGSELAALLTPSVKDIAPFVLLVLVLVLTPTGLLGGGHARKETAPA